MVDMVPCEQFFWTFPRVEAMVDMVPCEQFCWTFTRVEALVDMVPCEQFYWTVPRWRQRLVDLSIVVRCGHLHGFPRSQRCNKL